MRKILFLSCKSVQNIGQPLLTFFKTDQLVSGFTSNEILKQHVGFILDYKLKISRTLR